MKIPFVLATNIFQISISLTLDEALLAPKI